jgi:hypothetical protein
MFWRTPLERSPEARLRKLMTPLSKMLDLNFKAFYLLSRRCQRFARQATGASLRSGAAPQSIPAEWCVQRVKAALVRTVAAENKDAGVSQ